MIGHAAEFRRCLSECDVEAIQKLSKHVSPHLPQPLNDQEALATIHHARTQSEWLDLRSRAYSHSWLLDHNLPSGLPDDLKPKVERLYPRIVEGVGIAVKATSDLLKPIIGNVRDAMSNAIAEAYADNKTDPTFVKNRIMEARSKAIKSLVGKITK